MTNNNECKTEGCDKAVYVKKRQLCKKHYQIWARANRPKAGLKPCSIEGCDTNLYARGFCQNHYNRWKRWGDPEGSYTRKWEGMTCNQDDCSRPVSSNYMCHSHYMRWWIDNTTTVFDPNHKNVKEDIKYAGAHYRIRRIKGKATNYECVDCGDRAKDWTLRHDPSEKRIEVSDNPRTDGAAYSLNPDDYQPRCVDCHRAYDAKWENRKAKTGPKGPHKKVSA